MTHYGSIRCDRRARCIQKVFRDSCNYFTNSRNYITLPAVERKFF